jgi:hypothetical protein
MNLFADFANRQSAGAVRAAAAITRLQSGKPEVSVTDHSFPTEA